MKSGAENLSDASLSPPTSPSKRKFRENQKVRESNMFFFKHSTGLFQVIRKLCDCKFTRDSEHGDCEPVGDLCGGTDGIERVV